MSSAGQVIGGVVGAVVGFFTPIGPVYGAQIGMMIGGVIDPPDGPVINGPRLDDLSVQTSTYGAFIPRNYGTIAQHGNIFWLKGDALTETPRVEESGGKGGPTTTTNLWDYSATFALGLCEGPIDGIRRIWINGQLFYDGGSDDLATIIAGNDASEMFTLYPGTDTQEPDPLIQADKGAANVPAYRGLAYIVFENLPLEKYNNSLAGAQIKVEIIESGTIQGPRLIDSTTLSNWPHPAVGVKFTGAFDGVLSVYSYDVAAASQVLLDGEYYPDNEFIQRISYAGDVLSPNATPAGIQRPLTYSTGLQTIPVGVLGRNTIWWAEYSHTLTIGNGARQVIPIGDLDGSRGTAYANGIVGDLADYLPGETGRYVIGLAVNDARSRVLVTTGTAQRDTTCVATKYFLLDDSLAVLQSGSINNTTGFLWNIGQNSQYTPAGGTVISSDGLKGWTINSTNTSQIEVMHFTFDASDTLILETAIVTSVTGDNRIGTCLSDGILYVINCNTSTCELVRYTDSLSISSDLAVLGDIVEAECLTSSLLSASDLDVTELTDSVRGYRIASLGALRGGIDPLRAAWPFDVVQHGYQIKFNRRGSASVATITADELDARAAGDNPGVQITNSREMDTLLPSRLRLKYIDSVREYDINEQISDRGL